MKNIKILGLIAFSAISAASAFAGQHSANTGSSPKLGTLQASTVCDCGARLDGSKQHSHQISAGMQVKVGTANAAQVGASTTGNELDQSDLLSNGGSSYPKVGFSN